MRSLVRDRGMALLLITHDLGVVRELCERAVVLYAGRVVEEAPVAELLSTPHHPYTSGLGASIPSITGAAPAPAPDPGHAAGPGDAAPGLRLRAALPGRPGALSVRSCPALLDDRSGPTVGLSSEHRAAWMEACTSHGSKRT